MSRNLLLRPAVVLLAALGMAGCNDDGDDVTSTRGSLAAVEVEAPGSVQSGVEFGVDLSAANVGFSNIRNSRVDVTFEAPLSILSVDPSSGTTAIDLTLRFVAFGKVRLNAFSSRKVFHCSRLSGI